MSERSEDLFFPKRFEGQCVLILGGGGGIGRACAERMLREGATVVAADLDDALLASLAQVSVDGRHVDVVKVNANDESEVRQLVQGMVQQHGAIDILVNAIGGSTQIKKPTAAVDELRFDEWKGLIDFNLNPMFFACSAVVPHMKRQRRGKIVNVSSLAGRGISTETSAAYAAAKGGVNAFTRKLSLELGPHGINVNGIAPSLTLTERILQKWRLRPESEKEAVLQAIPLRRIPYAQDQAAVICFLASRDADFISGTVIDVAGGQ